MLVNTIFEDALDQLLDVAKRFLEAIEAAGIPCRVVGGLAVFLHVEEIDPLAARLTRDVDVAVYRLDLDRIRAAVQPYGFRHRDVRGIDMFLETGSIKARSAVHLIFLDEKVREGDLAEVPSSEAVRSTKGFLIAPVQDMVKMKLTSFRMKDKVHIQDMDSVGLITPEIEASLSPALRVRLSEERATE